MIKIFTDILEKENLFKEIPNNHFLYGQLLVKRTELEFVVQASIRDTTSDSIIKIINNNNYNKVVLSVRHGKEPHNFWNPPEYPTEETLTKIKEQTNKEVHLFYQDPWPAKVPNFIDDNTMYIQFGYNEGQLLHKNPKFTIEDCGITDMEYVFITNKNIIKLNNPKNELI